MHVFGPTRRECMECKAIEAQRGTRREQELRAWMVHIGRLRGRVELILPKHSAARHRLRVSFKDSQVPRINCSFALPDYIFLDCCGH